MKKSMAVFIALATLAAGVAAWADTNTLTVQASVTGTCKFSAATSTVNFGALDPSSAADASGSTTTNFWCTKGVTTDSIAADTGLNPAGGVRQMKDLAGTDLIPYSLTLLADGSSNAGPLSPRTLTITASITNANYVTKTAGSYADTVVLTITP